MSLHSEAMQADEMTVDVSKSTKYGKRAAHPRESFLNLLLILGLALGPIACSTSKSGITGPTHSPHSTYAALELNDGKKWVVAKPLGLTADYSKSTDPLVQQNKFQEIKNALAVFNAHFD